MRRELTPGEVIHGFTFVRESPRRTKRGQTFVWVECPLCGSVVERIIGNLAQRRSCGCARGRRAKDATPWGIKAAVIAPEKPGYGRWRGLVPEATQAFGSDFRYAEEIARAYHRIEERKLQTLLKLRV